MNTLQKRFFSQSTLARYPRFSIFSNRFEELATLTPATLERAEQAKLRNSDAQQRYVQQFTSTVVQTDGSTFTVKTSLPLQPRVVQVKDTIHHPLWNPRIRNATMDSSSEEFVKFKRKYVDAGIEEDDLASLAFSESAGAHFVLKKKVVAPAATRGKKKK